MGPWPHWISTNTEKCSERRKACQSQSFKSEIVLEPMTALRATTVDKWAEWFNGGLRRLNRVSRFPRITGLRFITFGRHGLTDLSEPHCHVDCEGGIASHMARHFTYPISVTSQIVFWGLPSEA